MIFDGSVVRLDVQGIDGSMVLRIAQLEHRGAGGVTSVAMNLISEPSRRQARGVRQLSTVSNRAGEDTSVLVKLSGTRAACCPSAPPITPTHHLTPRHLSH